MTSSDPNSDHPILESLPLHSTTLLTVIAPDGTIQYETPSIERIFGFDQQDLVGENVAQYVHPEDREAVMAAFQRLVESTEEVIEAVEYRHKTADGSWRWTESVGSSTPTPEGHYVINSRDISEQKRRERTLERQNERLEGFAKIVSHDLRSPLSVADGRLALAREAHDSDHLQAVDRAHDRMRTLIEDLLALAREGDAVADPEPVSLAELTEQSWANVDVGEATLDVRTDRVLVADRTRLAQLLENLLGNAVEHGSDPSAAGGAGLTVTVGDLDGGFYVEDDGEGLPEGERERIFETGYSTTADGTGIGLGIVETIAEAHGWSIEATGGNSGGARFEITGVESPDP